MKLVIGVIAAASAVTPTQKVVQLLENMVAKGKAEKQAEEVQFATYSQWCTDEKAKTSKNIDEAAETIELLSAQIDKHTTEAAKLGRQITKDEQDIATYEGDITASTKVRGIERDDFLATNTDYSESIDALGRAINVLKNQSHDRKQAEASFMEIKELMPPRAKKIVDAFLSQDGEDDADHLEVRAPEANAYEFQSQTQLCV